MSIQDPRPLILHVLYRMDTGGLENGVVNLINRMDPGAYRHAVLALTEVTDFSRRVQVPDVQFIALNKPPGHAIWLYPQLFRLLRELKPAVIHTRNLAALEVLVPAWAAGVPARVHGEHGREGSDLAGTRRRYQWMRRLYGLFAHRFVALSGELREYLTARVGLAPARVLQICNGVDAQRFSPVPHRQRVADCPFGEPGQLLFGTVGRMQPVKDQALLARAFVLALQQRPDLRPRLRLLMAGDGPQMPAVRAILTEAGVDALCWLPGERRDAPDFMRGLDVFVLPSLSEGISNTVLEAMATGLPVLATRVGGNVELVEEGVSGLLTPASDVAAMAQAMIRLADDEALRRAMGRAGRLRVEQRFSLDAMVAAYRGLYDELTLNPAARRMALREH